MQAQRRRACEDRVWTSVATAHERMEPQASWKLKEIKEDFNQELFGEKGALM